MVCLWSDMLSSCLGGGSYVPSMLFVFPSPLILYILKFTPPPSFCIYSNSPLHLLIGKNVTQEEWPMDVCLKNLGPWFSYLYIKFAFTYTVEVKVCICGDIFWYLSTFRSFNHHCKVPKNTYFPIYTIYDWPPPDPLTEYSILNLSKSPEKLLYDADTPVTIWEMVSSWWKWPHDLKVPVYHY